MGMTTISRGSLFVLGVNGGRLGVRDSRRLLTQVSTSKGSEKVLIRIQKLLIEKRRSRRSSYVVLSSPTIFLHPKSQPQVVWFQY